MKLPKSQCYWICFRHLEVEKHLGLFMTTTNLSTRASNKLWMLVSISKDLQSDRRSKLRLLKIHLVRRVPNGHRSLELFVH